MSMFEGYQVYPDDPQSAKEKVLARIKTFEGNRKMLYRWFWRGLFGFNCILASVVFWLRILLF